MSDRNKDGGSGGDPAPSRNKRGTAKGGSGKTRPDRSRRGSASDLGRALRSVYDDTLREPVPNDLSDLLGKLT